MADLSVNLLVLRRNLHLKSVNKIKPHSYKKAHTFGAPVLAPDYSDSVLVVKMRTNCHEHSI
jgi:hypothetical protein